MITITRIGYVHEDTRWKATIVYRVTETEDRTVIHHVMELAELQQLVENGPSFCTIKSFSIEYCGDHYTIEEGMKL